MAWETRGGIKVWTGARPTSDADSPLDLDEITNHRTGRNTATCPCGAKVARYGSSLCLDCYIESTRDGSRKNAGARALEATLAWMVSNMPPPAAADEVGVMCEDCGECLLTHVGESCPVCMLWARKNATETAWSGQRHHLLVDWAAVDRATSGDFPPALTLAERRLTVRTLHAAGLSDSQIADRCRTTRRTIERDRRALGLRTLEVADDLAMSA